MTDENSTGQDLEAGLAADGIAYLLCAKCEQPVMVDENTEADDEVHRCFCDDITRWRMLKRSTVSNNGRLFL